MTTDDTPIKIMMVPGGKVPVQATPGSAAYDLFARAVRFNSETRTLECDLGVRVEIPEGWCGLLLPRSSVLRHGLMMANSVGLIDSDYRGECFVALHNDSNEERTVRHGDRVAQLVLLPFLPMEFEQVDTLPETVRGEGGFGSTGR